MHALVATGVNAEVTSSLVRSTFQPIDTGADITACESPGLVDELSYLPQIPIEPDQTELRPRGARGVDSAAVYAVLVVIPPAMASITSFVNQELLGCV